MRKNHGDYIKLEQISSLFAIYQKKLRAPQKTVVNECIDVIDDIFAVRIKVSECAYIPQTKTMHIHIRGPFKSEVMLRKEEILTHLKGRLGEKSAPNCIL